MDGVVFDRFSEDRRVESVAARRMRLVRSEEDVFAEDVDAVRFADTATAPPRARVRAPRARLRASSQRTELSGGVTVVDAEGRVLETATVQHDAAQDLLQTKDEVVLRGPDFRLVGRGFELRPGQDTLEIGGPVRAVLDPEAPDAATDSSPRGARAAPRTRSAAPD